MRRTAAPENLAAIQEAVEKHAPDWKTYSCTLVTPMYGGGVKPGEVDAEMPIRASAIRGQLRFWWRVACARGLSAAEMFKRETAIWGGIGDKPTASKVEVRVSKAVTPKLEPAHTYPPNPKKPGELRSWPDVAKWADAYALFSAQGKLNTGNRDFKDQPKELAREGIAFQLCLRISSELDAGQKSEVELALRWWASFGGIGARTRRGLGAVEVKALQPVSEAEVAAQSGILKFIPVGGNPQDSWKKSVGRLKDFRQALKIGRNDPSPSSSSPAGRSLWPEADTLRELSQQTLPRHSERLVPGAYFPRAAFGLPIVFHFKDTPTKKDKEAHCYSRNKFDPEDHVLEPTDVSHDKKRDRMASPLILRPYWNGEKWQPAALLLPGWRDALKQPLKFKGQKYSKAPAHWPDDPAQRKKLAADISPMGKRADDPLSAFMQFFAEGK